MAELFKKPHNIKLPKSQHEVEEFADKKGLLLCQGCGAAYYKKHWHRSLEKLNLAETESVAKKDKSVKFTLCPACTMIANKQYEGRLIIKNIPDKLAEELESLIRGFCERAYDRDPLDRLIDIKKLSNGDWEVTTTENELANKLGKKIKDNFNKTTTRTIFNAEPGDVTEVTVEFQKS